MSDTKAETPLCRVVVWQCCATGPLRECGKPLPCSDPHTLAALLPQPYAPESGARSDGETWSNKRGWNGGTPG